MKRRRLLSLLPATLAASALPVPIRAQIKRGRVVPAAFEALPPIGLGTWLTFDIGDDTQGQEQRRQVLQRFFESGGGMIDSSPMYGRAEWLLGQLLATVAHREKLF